MHQIIIYGANVELILATQVFAHDIYIFNNGGNHCHKWLKHACMLDSAYPGRQTTYLDNCTGNGKDGHFDSALAWYII